MEASAIVSFGKKGAQITRVADFGEGKVLLHRLPARFCRRHSHGEGASERIPELEIVLVTALQWLHMLDDIKPRVIERS